MSTIDLRFALAIALCAGAFSACGDDELGDPSRFAIAGCESVDAAPCDVRTGDCQEKLFRVAACLRGEEPGMLPPIKVISEAEYAAQLRERAADHRRPSPDHEENALWLLGLLQTGALQPDMNIEDHAKLIGGFYRPESKEIFVVDHGEAQSSPEELSWVFVHEALHALQGRTVDLEGFFELHDDTEDSLLAARAMVEGEARFYDARYMAHLAGLSAEAIDWDRRNQSSIEREQEWTLMQPSRLTSSSLSFPYSWGARYLSYVFEAEGQQGIAERLVAPPKTTHALIASEGTLFEPELEPAAFVFPASTESWLFQSRTSLGAWGVMLAAALADNEEARALARAWRGDALFIYARSGDDVTAVVWKIELADPGSAAQFAERIAALGLAAEYRVDGARVVIAASTFPAQLDWAF